MVNAPSSCPRQDLEALPDMAAVPCLVLLCPLPLPVLSPVYNLLYMDGEGLGDGGAYSMRRNEAR